MPRSYSFSYPNLTACERTGIKQKLITELYTQFRIIWKGRRKKETERKVVKKTFWQVSEVIRTMQES